MIIISSREFRNNQATYLDKVDNGDEILVQRGRDKAYRITPITEFDTVIERNFILEPDNELQKAITFDELLVGVKEDLKEIFSGKKDARIG